MYIRPKLRLRPDPTSPPVMSSGGLPWIPLRDTASSRISRPELVPIWQPPEYPPEKPPPPAQKEYPHLCQLMQESRGHRPSLKDMVEAARKDGYSDEKIQRIRKSYAKMNLDRSKEDKTIERIFGANKKPVKKVLKVVKKRGCLDVDKDGQI